VSLPHHILHRGNTTERGYGWAWQKARAVHLMQHPLCVMCKEKGRITPATVVDHKIPHKGDYDLFWDDGNWQSLCATHHSSDKQAMEKGGKPKQTIGLDGWPE